MKGPRPEEPDFRALLGPGGPLAAEPFYEYRPGQEEMAAAVWRALRHEGFLLAEAGTGTGKSLAYLLPAAHLDRRVVISTGTKALQEQLARKDIPLLERILERPVRAVTVKGRANYLCLHYWRRFLAEPLFASPADAAHLKRLEAWAASTKTGDKAEWDGIPEELPTWREINARGERCLGSSCPLFSDCYVVQLRRQAEAADLVVTNHHLLCADLALKNRWDAAALPEYAHLVMDEAHEAEEAATSFFGVSVSRRMVQEWLHDAAKIAGGGEGNLSRILQDATQAVLFFFGPIEARGERREVLRAGHLGEREEALRERMDNALEAAGLALQSTDGGGEVEGLLGRLEVLREALEFVLDGADDAYVRYVEVRGRNVILGASPIDVGDLMRENLYGRLNGAVFTSATLTVGGSFAYFRSRMGIPEGAEELRLPSPFDYGRQGLLYVPARFPDPGDEGFLDALLGALPPLIGLSRGRAFVLCTSYRNMRAVAHSLEALLPFPVLVQGEEPKALLLERFRQAGNAVLVATASFWQGVDVQGEALSLVVIDKLPFAAPNDPLTQARIERLRKSGQDPFTGYQVPMAAIMLQQGVGRLIRSTRDRGVVACFDVRLRRRSYGRLLLASLPPFAVTESLESVETFFSSETEEEAL